VDVWALAVVASRRLSAAVIIRPSNSHLERRPRLREKTRRYAHADRGSRARSYSFADRFEHL